MKYLLSCLSFGILGWLLSTSALVAKQPKANSIGSIQNTEVIQDVGCFLEQAGKKGNVFWSGVDNSALMNIDGKDRILKFVSETPSDQAPTRRGGRSTVIYKYGKIIVRLDRVATRVCGVGELDCSTTDYNAKIKLITGNRQQVIHTTGFCGS